MAVITGTIDNDILLGTTLADDISGLEGNDFIDGGAGNDNILGGGGNDTILGGDGADTISGGEGSDSVRGQAGNDVYLFNVTEDAADTVDLGVGNDLVFVTNNTSNRVRLSFNASEVGNFTGAGPDIGNTAVTMQAVRPAQTGETGEQLIGPASLFDDEGILFSVGGGAFLFDVRDGATSLGNNFSVVQLGTSGADLYNGATFAPSAAIYVNGGAGNDQIRGGDVTTLGGVAIGDVLDGGAGNDTLIGGAGNDRLFGRAGDDTAQLNVSGINPLGGPIDGSDTIDLGEGNDVVRVARLTAGEVRLTFRSSGVGNGDSTDTGEGAGADGGLNVRVQGEDASGGLSAVDPVSRVDDEGVTFVGENGVRFDVRDISGTARGSFDIVQLGTAGADTMTAINPALAYYFNGGNGNDTIRGGNGLDFLVGGGGDDLLVGGTNTTNYLAGDGNDLILGSTGVDVADGGAGNDRIFGNTGNDTLTGGAGDDLLNGETGNDVLNGGDGADVLSGELGDDALLGGAGGDVMIGGAGNDVLDGEADNDTAFGGDGVDNLFGDAGNDSLNGEAGNDALNGEDGDDLMSGETGNDLLLGGAGSDVALGGAGDDTLNGEAGNDFLFGEAGSDVLSGEAGNDVLFGGAGGDALIGGAGADTFRFQGAGDSGTAGRDLILDFNAADGDRIDLSAIDADSGTTGDQGFTFVTTFSNVAGQMTRTFDSAAGTTRFEGDTNGDGVVDFSFDVVGDFSTSNTGFIL